MKQRQKNQPKNEYSLHKISHKEDNKRKLMSLHTVLSKMPHEFVILALQHEKQRDTFSIISFCPLVLCAALRFVVDGGGFGLSTVSFMFYRKIIFACLLLFRSSVVVSYQVLLRVCFFSVCVRFMLM